MEELRCESHLHGIINDEGLIEVKCRWKPCVNEIGVVVFHYFNAETGKEVDTKKFLDPSSVLKHQFKKVGD